MRIAIVSSEATPFAKTGGLADVAGALPGELSDLGHEVRLIMPKYKAVDEMRLPLLRLDGNIHVPLGDRTFEGNIFELHNASHNNSPATFFIGNDEFFSRDGLYGDRGGDYIDNASRFIFFSKGVLSLLSRTEFIPDIIHVNDWQSALTPLFLHSLYARESVFRNTASILTIHNLGYQGLFWHYDMPLLNIGWEYFTHEKIEFYGKVNFLKAGIVYADAITTVSKKYAEEIQTPESGFGLDGVLRTRREDLFGIVNGIDTDVWNPETDPLIEARYKKDDVSKKIENKRALLQEFYLPERLDIPVIGIISRLADQKGFDILGESMKELMAMDIMMVILGTGDKKYHDLLTRLGKEYPTKLGVKLAFDNRLAHLIEAGADLFLMPSRYEPCGLNQMMSMRYGTIPVVRKTGGLDDTVSDYVKSTGEGTGVKFSSYSSEELVAAVKRAVDLFGKKDHWQKIVKNAMSMDFSWRASAKKYEELYLRALKKKLDTRPQ